MIPMDLDVDRYRPGKCEQRSNRENEKSGVYNKGEGFGVIEKLSIVGLFDRVCEYRIQGPSVLNQR